MFSQICITLLSRSKNWSENSWVDRFLWNCRFPFLEHISISSRVSFTILWFLCFRKCSIASVTFLHLKKLAIFTITLWMTTWFYQWFPFAIKPNCPRRLQSLPLGRLLPSVPQDLAWAFLWWLAPVCSGWDFDLMHFPRPYSQVFFLRVT